MPRPALWRLDATAYPHRRAIQTRFQDMDVLGHINNVAFVALFETARTRFNQDAGLWDALKHRRAVVAQTEVNYLAEGSFPDDVEVGTGVLEIGSRSFRVAAAMFQHDRPIATCDAVLVVPKDEGGQGLSEAVVGLLQRWILREPDSLSSQEREGAV